MRSKKIKCRRQSLKTFWTTLVYMQGFPGIFCYILGVKVTDLVYLTTKWKLLKIRKSNVHENTSSHFSIRKLCITYTSSPIFCNFMIQWDSNITGFVLKYSMSLCHCFDLRPNLHAAVIVENVRIFRPYRIPGRRYPLRSAKDGFATIRGKLKARLFDPNWSWILGSKAHK